MNAGIYNCLLDMYFGTNAPDNEGPYGLDAGLYIGGKEGASGAVFDVTRVVRGADSVFTFTLRPAGN